jgi:hypothetical protein
MSAPSTLPPKRRTDIASALSYASIVLSAFAVGLSFIALWKFEELSTSTRVSVGMSEVDVVAKLGEPTWIYHRGDEVIPREVGSFTPDHHVEHRLLVYRCFPALFIFVFIDDRQRVTAVYSHRS